MAIAASSLFVIVSVLALGLAGRWMSGFGGLTVDERETTEQRIRDLEQHLRGTEAALEAEAKRREAAEDWADELADELDQARIESAEAKEALPE